MSEQNTGGPAFPMSGFDMRQALEWISRRCPAQFLQQEPHRIHWEAAYDAGACARAALDKARGEK